MMLPSNARPESDNPPDRPGGRAALPRGYDIALRWGITLAVAVLAGFFAGRWLDQKLGTTPLFMLILLFWGIGGSFYSLFLQVKKMQQDEEKKS